MCYKKIKSEKLIPKKFTQNIKETFFDFTILLTTKKELVFASEKKRDLY